MRKISEIMEQNAKEMLDMCVNRKEIKVCKKQKKRK